MTEYFFGIKRKHIVKYRSISKERRKNVYDFQFYFGLHLQKNCGWIPLKPFKCISIFSSLPTFCLQTYEIFFFVLFIIYQFVALHLDFFFTQYFLSTCHICLRNWLNFIGNNKTYTLISSKYNTNAFRLLQFFFLFRLF